jgi:toxin ParE1/3/4
VIVVITNEAAINLEQIGDHIAKNNPLRALSFVQELRRCYETLADFPAGYPLVPRYVTTGVRRCVHGNYLIFYCIGPETIDVLHVLPGAMDYERVLFPEV